MRGLLLGLLISTPAGGASRAGTAVAASAGAVVGAGAGVATAVGITMIHSARNRGDDGEGTVLVLIGSLTAGLIVMPPIGAAGATVLVDRSPVIPGVLTLVGVGVGGVALATNHGELPGAVTLLTVPVVLAGVGGALAGPIDPRFTLAPLASPDGVGLSLAATW